MNEDISNKLHTALYGVAPLLQDRERLIAEMGETIWLEGLEKMLLALPEDKRAQTVQLLNNDDLDGAVAILNTEDIDLDAILKEVATSVLDDVVKAGAQ